MSVCNSLQSCLMRLVLQVKFHENRLLSGSVDGLISVFDVANGFDEDEGFLVRSARFTQKYQICYNS